MKISLNWLKEYIDLSDMAVDEIATTLTDIGLEVDSVDQAETIDDKVIVAKIVDSQQHPGADKLSLCKVDTGDNEPVQIVCGAPNARAGIHVALAQVGAVLPGNFKIKKSKIRGEISFGMMCSERELGISDEHDQIIELSEPASLGQKVSGLLPERDTILDLGITPNRAECNGYLGIARDLAAKLQRRLKLPPCEPHCESDLKTEDHLQIRIQDQEGSARFTGLYIGGLTKSASPGWMQRRLEASGMRPLSLIVDVTNYVMLEFSQPIHAYDKRDVRGSVIGVRKAASEEFCTTLDGQKRAMDDGDLLICDGEGVVGIAGVMGGENSEVKDDTTEILLEVAHFQAPRIRKTARRLGLHTEASYRFERGIDIEALPQVSLRVAVLLQSCCQELGLPAPRVATTMVDQYPVKVSRRKIAIRLQRCRQILGTPQLTRDEMSQSLTQLGFSKLDEAGDRIVFEVPSWRGEIEREIDLIEEVGRMIGFDKVPYTMPTMAISTLPEDPFLDFCEEIRLIVADQGISETVSFPFVSRQDDAELALPEGHPLRYHLELANPIRDDQPLLQTNLVPNLLKALIANRRRGDWGARLFEYGRGFFDLNLADKAELPFDRKKYPLWQDVARPGRHFSSRARGDQARPVERHWLAIAIDQPYHDKSWQHAERPVDFFDGKQILSDLLHSLNVVNWRLSPLSSDSNAVEVPYLNPLRSAAVQIGPASAGYIGELHPAVAAALDFGPDSAPIVLEVDVERLFEFRSEKRQYQTFLRRYPPATRDLAFLVDQATTHSSFASSVKKFKGKKNLSRFHLFDVYQGENLPDGKKSLAYTFHFQSAEGTLSDKEVDSEISALTQWLESSLGAVQR